jgi:outer membrane murein-binding lipoprotein Lpp
MAAEPNFQRTNNPPIQARHTLGSLKRPKINSSFFKSRTFFIIIVFVILAGALMALTYSWQHQRVNQLKGEVTTLNAKISNLAYEISQMQSSVSSHSSVGIPVAGNTYYSCAADGGSMSGAGADSCSLNGVTYNFPSTFSPSFIGNYEQTPAGAQTLISKLGQTTFNDCVGLTANGVYPQTTVEIVTGNFIDVSVKDCSGGYSEYFEVKNNIWTDAGGTQDPLTCTIADEYHITKASIVITDPALVHLTGCAEPNGTISPFPS